MPALSIIIPCLGDAVEFDGTLVSVLQHRPADCEVIVVHRLPYDDPYDLGDEVRFLHWPGNSLIELLNAAIAEAEGDVLHIVGCGLEATERWTEAALFHFEDADVAGVAPVVFGPDRKGIVSAGIRWTLGGSRHEVTDNRILAPGSGRLRAQVIGPTLVAGFYRRDVLAALGGFEVAMGDELADVASSLILQDLGRLTVVEPAAQLLQVSPTTMDALSPIARGKALERLFWRSAMQRGLVASLATHGLSMLAGTVSRNMSAGFAVMAGRFMAAADVAAAHRYRQKLIEAESRLSELEALRAKRRKRAGITVPSTLRKAA